jgi:hypothetical protein
MLAGGTAWREGQRSDQRDALGRAINSGLGQEAQFLPADTGYTGPDYLGQDVTIPGTGMLGTTEDPQRRALLRFLGGLGATPGLRPSDALGIAQRVTELQSADQAQARTLDADVANIFLRDDLGGARDVQKNQWGIDAAAVATAAREAEKRGDYAAQQDLARLNSRLRREEAAAGGGKGLPPSAAAYPLPAGGLAIGPAPHTGDFAKGVQDVGTAAENVAVLDELLTSYHGNMSQGREFTGYDAGKQQALYQRAIGIMSQVGNTGVLNEGEYQRYSKTYPSPQAFFEKLYSNDKTLFGAMESARDQTARRYETVRAAHPWTAGVQGVHRAPGEMPTADSVARAEMRAATPADAARMVERKRVSRQRSAEEDARRSYGR